MTTDRFEQDVMFGEPVVIETKAQKAARRAKEEKERAARAVAIQTNREAEAVRRPGWLARLRGSSAGRSSEPPERDE